MTAHGEGIHRKIGYVLFDMDGLMIDSERIYTIATNEILAKYGKEMTWDIKAGLMGKTEREGAEQLLAFFPGISLSVDDYLQQRNARQDELWPTVRLLPGVERLVHHLKAHNIPMAIATSSKKRNFDMKTAHLQDFLANFGGRIICADNSPFKMQSKPAPDIFVLAAKHLLERPVGEPNDILGQPELVERSKGLVFEDSLPGVLAGKRAGMKVVWVPDAQLLNVKHEWDNLLQPDLVLDSLEKFQPENWGLPPYDD